ncbi:MAG: class I SAM-dependent methyltransferase [Candidatus Saccharimonadales bacterium]
MPYKSEATHAVLDQASRERKARKILAVIKQFKKLEDAQVLDIGTGSGDIPNLLSRHCGKVCSVDLSDERINKKGYEFKLVKDAALPYAKNSFDVVVSNQVIEHVPAQLLHIKEIYRVLKPGGISYIATPNKFWLTDPRHKLPLISWLPRPASNAYLKAVKKRQWDIFPVSYARLHQLSNNRGFKFENIAPHIIKNPGRYNLDAGGSASKLAARLPAAAIKPLTIFAPSFIIVLHKPD